jgi:hypothetical protein
MLKLRSGIVESIAAAKSGPDLFQFLQSAVELEHSTIPPYLTALYSIAPGKNGVVAGIIRSIVVQEMLHMTIAGNVLNAIGGAPAINQPARPGKPGFIPIYPGPLPMMVDDDLQVGLEKLSAQLVEKTFMRIEEPETPRHFPSAALAVAQKFPTIGAFYDAIIAKIRELSRQKNIFTGDPKRQVVDNDWFPPDQLFAVTDVDTAVRALTVIKDQGEGTTTDPLEAGGEPAHYYAFEEIIRGRRLVKDPKAPEGYSFTGAPVPFDPSAVIDIVSNSKANMYKQGSLARSGVDQANASYSNLLNALHETFNGSPSRLDDALGLMSEFRLVVLEKVVSVKDEQSGKFAAPAFEYVP